VSITTVLGEIEAADLGVTLAHEHLLIDLRNQFAEPEDPEARRRGAEPLTADNAPAARRNPYAIRDNLLLDDADLAAEEIARFGAAAGAGAGVVELTCTGIHPRPQALAEIARKSGLNVIAGCGYYTQDTHPPGMGGLSAEEIAEEMVGDLTGGIGGTGVRAGVIGEIGTGNPIHPDEAKCLRAAARAFARTNAAIYVHTYPWGREGLLAARLLVEAGVDPGKIVICHVDVDIDMDYMRRLLALGVFIEFDDFGKEFATDSEGESFAGGPFASDEERVRALGDLIATGFAPQMLITNDICLKCMLRAYGGRGYAHVLEGVVPLMRRRGIPQAAVRTLLVENPRRLLDA
jgi:phosphotriesterase-related protein